MNLEDDLRKALRREPAPPGFAATVLARASKTRPMPFWRRPIALPLAAMLTVTALVPSAIYQYRRQQRAIEARDQLIAALSITRTQLQQAKEKLRETTRHKR